MAGLADTAALVATLKLKTSDFTGPAASASRSLDQLSSKTATLGRISNDAGLGVRNLAGNVARIGAVAAGIAVTGLAFSVRAASDLNESMSKVTVVFGESADEIVAWAATAASAMGESRQQALEAAGTFGNLFQAFGLGQGASADMSTGLVQLAADLASFNNTSVDDALEALRSGVSGEMEPLRRFGVSLTDVRLRQKALELGLVKTTRDALTPAVKAQAAYALILQDTALAQGDFARTSGGLANQQRILKANLTDTAATIGTALLPKITEIVSQINTFVTQHQGDIQGLADELPAVFDSIMGIATNLPWGAIGDAFTLMGTGSRALLDAFTGLPPWVQTAVLTGWGLNKLTGGALGSIFSTLASGLIKGILGITAGVVNINAGVVNGGGGGLGGVVGGVGGGAAGLTIGGLAAIAGVAALEITLGQLIAENVTRPLNPTAFDFNRVAGASGQFTTPGSAEKFARDLAEQVDRPLDEIKTEIVTAVQSHGLTFDAAVRQILGDFNTGQGHGGAKGGAPAPKTDPDDPLLTQAAQQHQETQQTAIAKGYRDWQQQLQILRTLDRTADERRQDAVTALQTQAQSLMRLQQIAAKNFSPTVKVSVVSSVSISDIQRRITSQQIAIGRGFQEFE